MTKFINNYVHKQQTSICIFIDVVKAFNTFKHQKLLETVEN